MFSRIPFFESEYKPFITLTGPRNAIKAVSISPDGSFVCAVGYGGVNIWDLKTSQPVATPPLAYDTANPRLVFQSCAWLHFQGINKHVLAFGNSSGELFIWVWNHDQNRFVSGTMQAVDNPEKRAQLEKPGANAVASIDVLEPSVPQGQNGRLATSTGDRIVAVWSLSPNLEITQVFKVDTKEKDAVPRTVKFVCSNQDVYVFARRGGSFWQLQGQTAEVVSLKREGPKEMGSVTVDEEKDLFIAWTGQHAHAYRLTTSEHLRKFEGQTISLSSNPKQVSFAEQGTVVVVGSDIRFYSHAFIRGTEQLLYPFPLSVYVPLFARSDVQVSFQPRITTITETFSTIVPVTEQHTLLQPFTFTETVSTLVGHTETVSVTVSLAETVSTTVEHTKTVSTTITLTETVSTTGVYTKTLSTTLAVTKTISTAISHFITVPVTQEPYTVTQQHWSTITVTPEVLATTPELSLSPAPIDADTYEEF
ncbi:hypothetical protein VKT23_019409 [Stygiomarasmius scandens]|uniref:Uncharacterized protein n=1 Tax=Marasmiellus scandens TaxID=2682957 RepID=A0ABR1IPD7_9AGAR